VCHERSRSTRLRATVREMKEGPSGSAIRSLIPSHRELLRSNVEINKLFRLVRDDVMEATAGRQEPYTYGSLPGREDFFFVAVANDPVEFHFHSGTYPR